MQAVTVFDLDCNTHTHAMSPYNCMAREQQPRNINILHSPSLTSAFSTLRQTASKRVGYFQELTILYNMN